jgi:hypothetical protein
LWLGHGHALAATSSSPLRLARPISGKKRPARISLKPSAGLAEVALEVKRETKISDA